MESYIRFPKIHQQAVKNPKLMGGPFIDFEGERVNEVKDLLEKTKKSATTLLDLNNAFKSFEKLLHKEAVGNSLEPFYSRLPAELKGLVELVYDTSNHPSIRLIEGFLYKKYYDESLQGILLSFINGDIRPFIMSTPRIALKDEVYTKIPFSHQTIDTLFRARHEPIDVAELMQDLQITGEQKEIFLSFFTDNPTTRKDDRHYNGEEVRVRYFGHSCILLQTDKISILTDPIISYQIEGGKAFYTYNDLPDIIDYVVLTHNHQDHVLIETLLQLRHKIKNVIVPRNRKGALEDPSLKLILEHIGFEKVIEIDELETFQFENELGEITGLPFLGEHSDLNIQTKIAHCISLKGKKFLLAADSNNIDPHLYNYIFDFIGAIDVLFLGMECDGAPLSWLYAPYLPEPLKKIHDEERTLSGSNFEKAWSIVEKSGCKEAYVYAMGMEPWLTHIMALQYTPESIQITESDKFVQACIQKGIKAERLYIHKEWAV